MSSSTRKPMQRIEDMLKYQQDLAEAAQAQLHTLRQCNEQITAELMSMKEAYQGSTIVANGNHATEHTALQPLPQPNGPQVVEAPKPHGEAGKLGENNEGLRGEILQNSDKVVAAPNSQGEAGRLGECSPESQRESLQGSGKTKKKKGSKAGLRGETPRGTSHVLEMARSIELDFVTQASSNQVDPSEANAEEARWVKFVRSARFDMLVGGVIVANTIVMSLQLEVEGWAIKPGSCDLDDCTNQFYKDAFIVFEHVFTAIFALELIVRLATHGFSYLKTPANFGDCIVVVVSSLDSWVLTPVGSEALANIGVLRLLRLMRLAKVLRVVRVMNAFRSLRVIVSAVIASVGALAWSMTLLFVLILMFAILMAQLVRSAIEDEARTMESRMWLWDKFGTWYNAMLTVFEITMAPGGFISYRQLVTEIGPFMGLVLVLYVCSVTFAVIRVITAMFLKNTLSASDQDEASVILQKTKKLEQYFQKLQRTLESSHGPGGAGEAGLINETDLKELLAFPGMSEWFRLVGLDTADAIRLHRSMAKGSGLVQLSDFVTVLLRMRGGARACELIVLLHETRAISDRLFQFEAEVASPQRECGVYNTNSDASMCSV